MSHRRGEEVTPYFKAPEAAMIALLRRMPVREAILTHLTGRLNYRKNPGAATRGELLDVLECSPRTLQNTVEVMVKDGELTINGPHLVLTGVLAPAPRRTPKSAPTSAPSIAPSSAPNMGKLGEENTVQDSTNGTPDLLDSPDSLEEPTTTPPNPPQAGGGVEGEGASSAEVQDLKPPRTPRPNRQTTPGEPGDRKRERRADSPGRRAAGRHPAWVNELPPLPPDLAAIPGVPEGWRDFVTAHVQGRKRITPTAAEKDFAKLRRSPDPVAMLEHSTACDYQGLFEAPVARTASRPARVDVSGRDSWTDKDWLS
ncbi:MAG TPA: hypothetical protein VHN99_11915 [Deinococcales bacterium]|nr:hypothetical protein [Deinococcales bacterium]